MKSNMIKAFAIIFIIYILALCVCLISDISSFRLQIQCSKSHISDKILTFRHMTMQRYPKQHLLFFLLLFVRSALIESILDSAE